MSDHDGKSDAIQYALLAIDGIASIESKNEFSELPNVLCDGELPFMAIKCGRAPSIGNGLMIATDRRVVWLRKGRDLVVKQMSYAEMASIEAKRPGGTITFVGPNDKLELINTTKSLTLAFVDFVREKAAMAHVPQGSYPDDDAVATNAAAVDEHLVGLDSDTPKSAAIKDALRTVQGIHGIGIKNEFAELPNVLADGELPRAAMKCAFDGSWGSGLAVATDQRIVWLRQGRNVDVRDVSYSAMVSVEAKEGKIDGELIVTFVNDLGSLYELKLTNTTKTLTSAFADFVREKVDSDGARFGTVDRALGLIYASDPKAAAIRAALRNADGINELADRMDLVNLPKILNDGELPAMLMACSVDSDIGLLLATNERIIHIHTIKGGKRISWKNQMSYAELTSVEVSDSGDAIKFSGVADELRVNNTTGSLTSAFADFVREKAAMAHVPQGSYPDDDAVATNAAAVDEHLVGLDSETPKSAAIKDALRTVQGIHGIGIKNEFGELPNVLADGELPRAAMKCSIPESGSGKGLAVATDQRIVWLRKGRNVEVRDVPYSAMVSVEAKEGKLLGELTVTFVNDLGSLDELNLTSDAAPTTKTLTSAFADFVREKAAMAHVPQGSYPDDDAVATNAAAVDEHLVGLDSDTPKAAAIKDALRTVQGIHGIGIKNEFAELPNVLADGELPRAAMKCALFDASGGSGLAVATDQRIVWLRKGRNVDVRDVSYSAMVSVEAKEGKVLGELTVTFVNDLGSLDELKLANTTKTLTSAFADFVREKVDSDGARFGTVDRAFDLIYASDPKAAAIRAALRNADGINELAGRMELVELPKVLNDGELPAMLMACSVGSDIGLLLATNERIIHIKGGKRISWKNQMSYAELTSVEVSDLRDAIKFSGVAGELRVNNATASLTLAFADFVREKAAQSIAAKTEAAEQSQAKAKVIIEALRASGADNAMFSNWEVKALPDILDDGELPEKIIGGQYNGSIGVLVATDRRLLFVDRGSFGSLQVEDFPYPTIQSVLSTAGMMYGSITIKSAGSSALIDNTLKRFSHEMANFVRKKAMDFNGTAAPVAATGTANQVSLADELIKLSQLRESGILTDEEFQMQKDRLLA